MGKRFRIRSVLRALALLALTASVAAPAKADSVDDYVRGVMEKKKIPGVSVAIVRGGKSVKAEGYGFANLELDAKATADTIYQSGSVGKQFTAAGILLLAFRYLGEDDLTRRPFIQRGESVTRVVYSHLTRRTNATPTASSSPRTAASPTLTASNDETGRSCPGANGTCCYHSVWARSWRRGALAKAGVGCERASLGEGGLGAGSSIKAGPGSRNPWEALLPRGV